MAVQYDRRLVKGEKENKMAKQLLPNGKCRNFKGATKLMTIGIEVEMEGDEKTYDYIAIPIRKVISIQKPCSFLCRRISRTYLS